MYVQRAEGVDVFDLLQRDVLSLTQLDQVLDTVNDLEATDRVDGGDVARVEPAISVNRLCRLGLVLVVWDRVDGSVGACGMTGWNEQRGMTMNPRVQSSPRGTGLSVEK